MKMRHIAATAPLAAALVLGIPATSATAAPDSTYQASSADVSAQAVWEYTGKDFYYQSDCAEEGEDMLAKGYITAYRCDGSEWFFDDYSLFVVWDK